MLVQRGSLLLAFVLVLLVNSLACGYEFGVRERFVADAERPEYVPGEVLVAFKPGTLDKVRYNVHEQCGAMAAYPSFSGRFERVKFNSSRSVEDIIAAYENEPDVLYAEPNYIAHAFFVPNDPLYGYQWNFHSSEDVPGGGNLEQAWDISTGDESVVVAVVDSGVAYEDYRFFRQAPELVGVSFVPGYDFVDDDSHPNDENGHGTHVTGIIAQRTNNGIGVAGAAFSCSIMPIRVLDVEASGATSMIIDGIDFAVDNAADVINISLGSFWSSTSLELTLKRAHDMGVVVVAAGGNEYLLGSPKSYPAAYDDYCITVGAVRYDGQRAPYSTIGDFIDLSAPGGDLSVDQDKNDYPDGILQQSFMEDPREFKYLFGEGTSSSAPHVSAAAAMIIACGLTDPDDIAMVLELSARDNGPPGWDSQYGYGILDVYAALKYASKQVVTSSGNIAFSVCDEYGRLIITDGNDSYLPESEDECENEISPQQNDYVTAASSHDLSAELGLGGLSDPMYLYQNYPNPFNAETWIPFRLRESSDVIIRIYTLTGQLVRTLDLGHSYAGSHTSKSESAYWDGKNEAGENAASRTYFYSMRAGDFTAIRKMLVTR